VVTAGAFTIAHRSDSFQRSNGAAMVCVSALGRSLPGCIGGCTLGKGKQDQYDPAAAQDRII